MGHSRGEEIQSWLDAHAPEANFVILDDGNDVAPFIDRLVQSDEYEGLTFEGVGQAVALFEDRSDPAEAIWPLLQAGSPKLLQLLDEDPQLLSARGVHDWTLVHLLAAQGVWTRPEHEKILRELLARGADPNARDVIGQTPLHLIAANGARESLGVTQILLQAGADPRARTEFGFEPLRMLVHGAEIGRCLREAASR